MPVPILINLYIKALTMTSMHVQCDDLLIQCASSMITTRVKKIVSTHANQDTVRSINLIVILASYTTLDKKKIMKFCVASHQ